MILRLVELAISGSPDECMDRFLGAAVLDPIPDIAVFPELFTTGYVLDAIPELALDEDALPQLPPAALAGEKGIWIVAGTLPVRTPRGVVNRMVIYGPKGDVRYMTEKVHLFRQMGEDRSFVPGTCGGTFDLDGTLAGGIVCYDLRFPELTRRLTLRGARIVFVPAQWPSGRKQLFRSLLRARSAEAQTFTVGCNIGGEHLGVLFDGGGGVAHPGGRMVKGNEVTDGVSDFEIDLADVDRMRNKIDCLRDRRPIEYGDLNSEGG